MTSRVIKKTPEPRARITETAIEDERVQYHIQARRLDENGSIVWVTVCRPYYQMDYEQARKHLHRLHGADEKHRLVRVEVVEVNR